jgi:hypothetical protein
MKAKFIKCGRQVFQDDEVGKTRLLFQDDEVTNGLLPLRLPEKPDEWIALTSSSRKT